MISLLAFLSPTGAFLASIWQSSVLSNDSWMKLMNGLRIGLTIGGALLLIYEVRSRRLGERIPERTRKNVAIAMAALSFGAYFYFINPNVRYPDYYHRHEFFHYYLGSKYSKELSYTRLYECAAVAEVELGRGAEVRRRELRDLKVNLIKKVTDTYVVSDPAQCKSHFSPKSWEAFKKDVDWFYSTARGSYWENMQKDHGYNPPPVWTMEGKILSSIAPAGDKFFKVLASIDILFMFGACIMVFWAFGWRIGAIATIFWGCNAPADFYWTGGAFLRQDWIFFLIASLCLARKRMFFLAGFALTWSALLRVFPMIFFAGWAIVISFHVIREIRKRMSPAARSTTEEVVEAGKGYRAKPTKKQVEKARPAVEPQKGLLSLFHADHRRLLAGCIVAVGLLVPASVIAAGPDSYKEFFAHTLLVHNKTALTNHMGLETMLVHDWEGRMRFTRDDNLDDPFQKWKEGRNERHDKLKWVHRGIVGILFLWTMWALRRTKLLWVAMALSAPLCMSMTNLTCYYYSMFALTAALAAVRKPLGVVVLVASGASQVLILNYYWVDDKFTAQAWLFAVFSLVLLAGYSRPFSMARLLAWWHGKPEPKSSSSSASGSSGTAQPTPAE